METTMLRRLLPFLAGLAIGLARPCEMEPLAGTPACDVDKSPLVRAQYLVSLLNTTEKVKMLSDSSPAIPRLHIEAYEWWSEALHGLAYSPGMEFKVPTVYATSFPQTITLAATFNRSVWAAVGSVIGREARAFSNERRGGLTFWAPTVNLIRDPRWGRCQETAGEDPWHAAAFAERMVVGLQGDGPYIKAGATCKHAYAYDLDNTSTVNRETFDANVTVQDEVDTYLPGFHACVRNGKPLAIMCGINSVNGVPSCANPRIAKEVARGQWNFTGFVTSDHGAVRSVSVGHGYLAPDEACSAVLRAGLDVECGDFFQEYLLGSIGNGTTPMPLVDAAAANLFAAQIRLGVFDPTHNQPYLQYTFRHDVNTRAAQLLAQDAATQGVVLLKNTGRTLPLNPAAVANLAIIGPNSEARETLKGNFYGPSPFINSFSQGLQQRVESATFNLGCPDVWCTTQQLIPPAARLASEADAVVLVVGIDSSIESLQLDRASTALPGYQNQLIEAVANACRGPLVVVVMAGGSVDFSAAKLHPKVQSILWVGYPGQSAGAALADVVFGDASPSGRLPHTQYFSNYTDGLDATDMNWRAEASRGFPGRSYRFFSGPVVYPYGSGLSYTEFSYTRSSLPGEVSVAESEVSAAIRTATERHEYSPTVETPALLKIGVSVANAGGVASALVVICFAVPPLGAGPDVAAGGFPVKFSVGSEKVHLRPQQEAAVYFELSVFAISAVNRTGHRVPLPGTWTYTFNGEAPTLVNVH